jgi:NAD(P)-dependent dehydrogenase (short-subunit alcohol dehydrogenase family)
MNDRNEPKSQSKVAIVTGGSRGIGLEVAKGLAEDGYSLAIVARSKDGLLQALQELDIGAGETTSRKHTIHAVDVADAKAVKAVVDRTLEQYGRIDLLVNNAGIHLSGTLDVSVEEFQRGLNVNLVAPFAFMQAVLPVMKAQRSGHIINIASRAGKVGFASEGAYGAGKSGLVGLAASAYRELAQDGIKVTTVCPGWTNTDMARVRAPMPPQDMIQPADILRTVRWLLGLAPATCVREVVIECFKSIH